MDRGQIHTWTDLVKAFLAKYDHVVDTAPDRMTLMTIEKKEIESFKEYAHRWRDLASQIQPLLIKKETTFIFMNTLPKPYYDKMKRNAMQNFVKIVWSGELIEHGIKNKKIERKATPALTKKTIPVKKKERDAYAVFTNQH